MKIPDSIKLIAQKLRNKSTKAEVILWNYIKNEKLGIRFLRQKSVYVYTEDNGFDRFIIADFYCFEKKLILEIDGNIHDVEEIYELDNVKEELLKNLGFKVLRIRNEEIFEDVEKVLGRIREAF